ncbi:hypothetical protein M426DRAFT_325916 [Hypoxylon sp. CI-4A]|nr:hypothetical protein M426DRAFT_325916 [Hypoxylon sp. CI-4A]
MYEDSWYNFVPDHTHKRNPSIPQPTVHRRRESLLQQPNSNKQSDAVEPLEQLFEEPETSIDPPEATLNRRAKSYSDFYHVVRAQLSKDAAKKRRKKIKERNFDALMIDNNERVAKKQGPPRLEPFDDELIGSSQQEYLYGAYY